MILCPYCKQKELADNARFCGKCGHKIARCPTCGRILTTKQKFCKNDGTLLSEDLLADLPEQAAGGPETSQPQPTPGGMGKDDATVLLGRNPNTGTRFCKKCGKPCAPGQTLCEECRKAAFTQTNDTKTHSNKRLAIVIAVVLALLIVAGVTVAAKTGLFSGSSGGKDVEETDTTESNSLLPTSEDGDSSEALEAQKRISAVSLDTLTATLSADDSALLTATVTPEDWEGELTWSSSNEEVATVIAKDNYTATVYYAGAGTCTITVSAEEGTASCVLTCEESEEAESETADQDEEDVTIPTPVNSMYYNGHTYAIYNVRNEELSTWDETVSFCESLGGHLAVINSEAENDELYQFVLDSGLHLCFFGYSDEGSEGDWEWVYGESDYENWASGQPNNGANNSNDAAENYAEFYESTADGQWNDAPFAINTYHFLCEWESDDITFDD